MTEPQQAIREFIIRAERYLRSRRAWCRMWQYLALAAAIVTTLQIIDLFIGGTSLRVASLALIVVGVVYPQWLMRCRPIAPAEVAAVMDRAWHLNEQLATAGELAFADHGQAPAARACYQQVAPLIAGRDPRESQYRKSLLARRAALAGTLLLACLVTTLWGQVRAYHQRLGRREPGEYLRIADATERTLQAEDLSPMARRELEGMLAAAERMDEAALQEHLAELQRQGYEIVELDAPSLMRALHVPEDTIETIQGRPAPPTGGEGDPLEAFLPDQRVRVYGTGQEGEDASGEDVTGRSFDDAWSDAQRRAATQLRTGDVPPEYRAMVRVYFDLIE